MTQSRFLCINCFKTVTVSIKKAVVWRPYLMRVSKRRQDMIRGYRRSRAEQRSLPWGGWLAGSLGTRQPPTWSAYILESIHNRELISFILYKLSLHLFVYSACSTLRGFAVDYKAVSTLNERNSPFSHFLFVKINSK